MIESAGQLRLPDVGSTSVSISRAASCAHEVPSELVACVYKYHRLGVVLEFYAKTVSFGEGLFM